MDPPGPLADISDIHGPSSSHLQSEYLARTSGTSIVGAPNTLNLDQDLNFGQDVMNFKEEKINVEEKI